MNIICDIMIQKTVAYSTTCHSKIQSAIFLNSYQKALIYNYTVLQ